MHRSLTLAAIGVVFVFANAAYAGDSVSTPAANTPKASAKASGVEASQMDPNEVICKRGTAPVGSLIPAPSICHTRLEWDRLSGQTQHDLDQMMSHTVPVGNGG